MLVLLDLKLTEEGLEGNEKLVPLVFHVAQRIFIHFAQKTQRRTGGDEAMDFVARDRAAINGRKNQFEFLREHALEFQELVLIFGRKFFGARHGHERVELLPAFEVVLHSENDLFDVDLAHTG